MNEHIPESWPEDWPYSAVTEAEKLTEQRDDLLDALRKIATADISDGMVRYELKEIAREAIKKVEG